MTETQKPISGLSADDPEFVLPRKRTPVNEPVTLLRLPPDTGRKSTWEVDNVPARYQITSRIFYQDPGAGEGQVLTVAASVAFLVGHDQGWRYSVGVTVRNDGPNEAGHTGYSLAYGDVGDEAEARWKAEEGAALFLHHRKLPPPPAPIPNLDLVTAVASGETQMDRIKRRLHLLRDIAENIEDEDFVLDERMRGALAHVATDTEWLIDAVDEHVGWGSENVQELERLLDDLKRGKLSDGYHSHNELYEQRMLLNAHLAQRWYAEGVPIVKSWRHHTGEECLGGGWFIVVMQLVTGQVSFHYPARAWELFNIPDQELPPVWDGHTPQVGVQRLREALALFPPNAKMQQRRCANTDEHDAHYYTDSRVFWCPSAPHTLKLS